jgi:hypothetical protein
LPKKSKGTDYVLFLPLPPQHAVAGTNQFSAEAIKSVRDGFEAVLVHVEILTGKFQLSQSR